MTSNDKDEDVWASDCSETEYERQIAEREWSRLNENFGNEGYKEGLSEGKEQTLESCFGDGFTEGGKYGMRMGELRGWLSSLLVSARTLHLGEAKIEELRKLEEELRWYKSDKMFSTDYFRLDGTRTILEKQKPSTCEEESNSCCQNNGNLNCSSESESTTQIAQNSSSDKLEVLPDNMPYADKFQDKLPAQVVREYEEKVTNFINSLGLNISL